ERVAERAEDRERRDVDVEGVGVLALRIGSDGRRKELADLRVLLRRARVVEITVADRVGRAATHKGDALGLRLSELLRDRRARGGVEDHGISAVAQGRRERAL